MQAEQITFLPVEQRTARDPAMHHALAQQKQLIARHLCKQIFRCLQLDDRRARRQILQPLPGKILQAIDQCVGVGRLFPSKYMASAPVQFLWRAEMASSCLFKASLRSAGISFQ